MNKQEVTFPSFLKNWLMRKDKIQMWNILKTKSKKSSENEDSLAKKQ